MDVGMVENLALGWKDEMEQVVLASLRLKDGVEEAWDDVFSKTLPRDKVDVARREEVDFMVHQRKLWDEVPLADCWNKTGKAPMSVRWVDTDKGHGGDMQIRSRLVARDFKGNDKDRDDLFAETPPLEAKRLLFSRAATMLPNGKFRKLLFIDAKKAHLNPKCEQDVYIQLPEECNSSHDMCGKLNFWLYGFRQAASAWEALYAGKLQDAGFERGVSCGVVFYHPGKDISLVVHGDDFTFCALEPDLVWIQGLMQSWFPIKIRAMIGGEIQDDKEVVILNRLLRWTPSGLEYEADPRHRSVLLEHFGLNGGNVRGLTQNGSKMETYDSYESEYLEGKDATMFRALTARLNYLSLDCPDLQFPIKQCSREMSNPMLGSWKPMKKIVRYLVNRKSVVWTFEWQTEQRTSYLMTDSDWGGNSKDRRSTSGGVWMIGNHCIKTWSATQGAYALSSAEAELYAMIEGVTRAKGLRSLAEELGFSNLSNAIKLGTDSSAAKSFVCRRGLGKMRHLEIRDLWIQKEVQDGKLIVEKIPGEENPADLMTKILSTPEIIERLKGMNIQFVV